jgi:hypothetical protein
VFLFDLSSGYFRIADFAASIAIRACNDLRNCHPEGIHFGIAQVASDRFDHFFVKKVHGCRNLTDFAHALDLQTYFFKRVGICF